MTTFLLKIVALVTMVIDHGGDVIQTTAYSSIGDIMRYIGRIAFPLYAFLICEGCRRSKNIHKYLVRLLAFALISEIPYNLFSYNIGAPGNMPISILNSNNQNVFFTLFLGALSVYAYQTLKQYSPKGSIIPLVFGLVGCVFFAQIAQLLHTDYGLYGVMLIYTTYVADDLIDNVVVSKILVALTMSYCLYQIYSRKAYLNDMRYFYVSLTSVILVLLYNGKKGLLLKWFFYLFYPLHLLVLFGIWYFFIRSTEFLL